MNVISRAADDRAWLGRTGSYGQPTLAMIRRDARSFAPFEDRMHGNEPALIENADEVRQLVHLDDAARSIGNRVVVAADRDQAIVADTSFEFEKCIERPRRQRLQFCLFGGEGLRDNPLRRAVKANIGDARQPLVELRIEII